MSIASRIRTAHKKQPTRDSRVVDVCTATSSEKGVTRTHHLQKPYIHPIPQNLSGLFQPDKSKEHKGGAFGPEGTAQTAAKAHRTDRARRNREKKQAA